LVFGFKNHTELTSPVVFSPYNQKNDVQIADGGKMRHSVIPYRKQLFVSHLTSETAYSDVLEFIEEVFKFPYDRKISFFKISDLPEIFNVLSSKSFRLNDELVIHGSFPYRRRTNNRLSTVVPSPNN